MAKADVEKQNLLEQENAILKAKIASLETHSMENVAGVDTLSNEMKKIRQKGRSSANTIAVREQTDHYNISLWTKWGKRIGPMHPDNAIQTLNRFADMGIILSADRPTEAQLEAYAETSENKKRVKAAELKRASRNKSKKAGAMDRLAEEISKLTGMKVSEINNIIPVSK